LFSLFSYSDDSSVGSLPGGSSDRHDVVVETCELPGVVWAWDDGKLSHVSQGQTLLSGVDIDKPGAVEGVVGSNGKQTIIAMDMTDSLMYHVEAYNAYFKDAAGDVLYDDKHAKTAAFAKAVADAKGDSVNNKMMFIHKEETYGITVDQELVPQTVRNPDGSFSEKAVKAFQVGNKHNPQNMVHLEMVGAKTGFWANDPKKGYTDFTFKKNDGPDPAPNTAPTANQDRQRRWYEYFSR